jgi:hypothetical protein
LTGQRKEAHPLIVCKGNLSEFKLEEFFVLLENRAIKVDTLIAAVDLAYKCFYVMNYIFPPVCFGTWQFLDYVIFDMNQKVPMSPSVSEIAAFVCNEG